MYTMYREHYAHASPLRYKNASLKTAFSLTVLLLCLILDSIAVSLWITASMMAVSVVSGRVKPSAYLRLLAVPLFFILFAGAALLLATGDGRQVLAVTLRALGAVSSFYFLTLSTPVSGILSVLQKCHVPPVLTGLMYLVYRFIFVLTDVWHSLHTAAQARLGCRDYRTSMGTFGRIGSSLLLLSLKRADDCYNAMQARCYEGTIHFHEKERSCSLWDVLSAVVYIAVTAGIGRFCG